MALNGSGVSFALINWYAIPQKNDDVSISRGEVVDAVCSKDDVRQVTQRLHELPLSHIRPFRLIGIFPREFAVVQWRWDLAGLTPVRHEWQPQQWISSGLDEPRAQEIRGRTFAAAWEQADFGSLAWLRRLHGSHSPATGPFSTCMHRSDAATVSYSEIEVTGQHADFTYRAGPPCAPVAEFKLGLLVDWPRLKPAANRCMLPLSV